ncbi:MAG: MBL fold metallo-hydrolase [Actinobacteria bacterium]|nr:MBL fold metallo-hydrolase [Actinomycetota bacterium]
MAAKQEVKKMVLGEFAVNCYILTVDNANIIIDAGAEPELIEKYLNDEKIIPDFLLNTHGHYDHIGAVTEIISIYKIPFYIHKSEEFLIKDPGKNMSSYLCEKGLILKTYNLIDDKNISFFNKYGLRIFHTPGHTPGSITIAYQDLLFTGDLLFKSSIGRTDLPGGDGNVIKRSLASLKKLKSLNPEFKVLPGHGESSMLDYEFKNNYFLADDFLREVDQN